MRGAYMEKERERAEKAGYPSPIQLDKSSTDKDYNEAIQLGFEKISDGVPNYWYVEPNIVKRIHRFTLRKTKTDNQELTEYQNRTAQGFTRVWDCGSSKWEWPNQLTA